MTIFHNIGIIGLGLMGGSIAKALEGKKQLFLDADLLDRLDEIDVLILAVPLSAILEIAQKIASLSSRKRPLVVFDIGSVKENIAEAFEQWTKEGLEFVATHPMAGKHQRGIEYSDSQMFQNAPWIITPHDKNTKETLQQVEDLLEMMGARTLRMTAKEHDRRAALVSHMPYCLSKALLEFVSMSDPQSLAMAGPGFASMTRLAHDNRDLHIQIGAYNKKNIANTLREFIDFLEKPE